MLNIKLTRRFWLSSFAQILGRVTAWLIRFLWLAPKFARSVLNAWFNRIRVVQVIQKYTLSPLLTSYFSYFDFHKWLKPPTCVLRQSCYLGLTERIREKNSKLVFFAKILTYKPFYEPEISSKAPKFEFGELQKVGFRRLKTSFLLQIWIKT